MKELNRLVDLGVLVFVEEPTDRVNQMVVTDKKDGSLRLCIEPRPLNKALKREHHRLPVLDDVLPKLHGATTLSVVDLKNGYWHVELDHESSLLTTTATQYGRYRWTRLPFGLKVSSEIFQKRLFQALDGLGSLACIADDILVWGKGVDTHDASFDNLCQRGDKHGMKFKFKKLQFKSNNVNYYGQVLTNDGMKPDPGKFEAILNMPKPKNVDDVQRLKGMVGYLARFMPKLSNVIRPIAMLTHLNVVWTWDSVQDKAFRKVKKLLTDAPVLRYFDLTKQLDIQADASGEGLGAALMQDGHPIAYSSKAMSETEKRYSTIEKEMLAIVTSLEKWHQFTYGHHVVVYSDHKPLQSVTSKPLDRAPRRLQSFLVRALAYDIDVKYLEGRKMFVADTLSRAYVPNTTDGKYDDHGSVSAVSFLPMRKESGSNKRRN